MHSRSPGSPQRRSTVSLNVGSSLPVPPPMMGSSSLHRSSLTQQMAKSMTIEEMRHLHQRALSEAEAKRTELRLVLASRYRELVGSSDEVIKMKERSEELHDLINALPTLMEKLSKSSRNDQQLNSEEKDSSDASVIQDINTDIRIRRSLSSLPRLIHRLLDSNNVYGATVHLIDLFTLIASKTDAYPLANQLAKPSSQSLREQEVTSLDPNVKAQLKMVYLQMMAVPDKITRIAKRIMLRPASYGKSVSDPVAAAERSAAALAAVDLLDQEHNVSATRASALLDIYFDSKAKLLISLLEKLSVSSALDESVINSALNADEVLSKIVLILQYDIILHPHAIFLKKSFESAATLPEFDMRVLEAKVSKFLADMLPLVRSKARSVLVNIAGTTAAALGQIRQSLYDKTDGAEVTKSAAWVDAVGELVNVREVFQADTSSTMEWHQRQFSLWSALFSTTFSSLVNSLLNNVFGSVHSNVIATLTASLANAPSLTSVQPHEAYQNTLKIAVHLDQALLKVSEDAHELLVHAEEREESERRLRQSLYVQTCEILGRLLHELRRMAVTKGENDADATKSLIIGRLCFLLKFRLTALPKLLDPQSSPAALQQTLGMISFVDLQSAFELADDDDDGVITMAEALEAVESAFSGTQFRGAEMLRETLLLDRDGSAVAGVDDKETGPFNVTLHELTLLTTRGLRHEGAGPASALGTFQASLDSIVAECFSDWAGYATINASVRFETKMTQFVHEACTESDDQWTRLHQSAAQVGSVSPHLVGFIIELASILNRTICPSDSISPVSSTEYARTLGVKGDTIPTGMDRMRYALLCQCVSSLASFLGKSLSSSPTSQLTLESMGKAATKQLFIDIAFIKKCFADRPRPGLGQEVFSQSLSHVLERISAHCARQVILPQEQVEEYVEHAFAGSDAWFVSFLREKGASSVSPSYEPDLGTPSSSSSPLFHMPLVSSVRFNVLPVQADRSLNEIQLREKYAKAKETPRPESLGGSVMSSGLGFMSTGLGFFKK